MNVRAATMAIAAATLADQAKEIGLEAAAGLIDARLEGWKVRAASTDWDDRLAKVMVNELTMLAAGIRALK